VPNIPLLQEGQRLRVSSPVGVAGSGRANLGGDSTLEAIGTLGGAVRQVGGAIIQREARLEAAEKKVRQNLEIRKVKGLLDAGNTESISLGKGGAADGSDAVQLGADNFTGLAKSIGKTIKDDLVRQAFDTEVEVMQAKLENTLKDVSRSKLTGNLQLQLSDDLNVKNNIVFSDPGTLDEQIGTWKAMTDEDAAIFEEASPKLKAQFEAMRDAGVPMMIESAAESHIKDGNFKAARKLLDRTELDNESRAKLADRIDRKQIQRLNLNEKISSINEDKTQDRLKAQQEVFEQNILSEAAAAETDEQRAEVSERINDGIENGLADDKLQKATLNVWNNQRALTRESHASTVQEVNLQLALGQDPGPLKDFTLEQMGDGGIDAVSGQKLITNLNRQIKMNEDPRKRRQLRNANRFLQDSVKEPFLNFDPQITQQIAEQKAVTREVFEDLLEQSPDANPLQIMRRAIKETRTSIGNLPKLDGISPEKQLDAKAIQKEVPLELQKLFRKDKSAYVREIFKYKMLREAHELNAAFERDGE